jgi:hypothetical protein
VDSRRRQSAFTAVLGTVGNRNSGMRRVTRRSICLEPPALRQIRSFPSVQVEPCGTEPYKRRAKLACWRREYLVERCRLAYFDERERAPDPRLVAEGRRDRRQGGARAAPAPRDASRGEARARALGDGSLRRRRGRVGAGGVSRRDEGDRCVARRRRDAAALVRRGEAGDGEAIRAADRDGGSARGTPDRGVGPRSTSSSGRSRGRGPTCGAQPVGS